MVARGILLTVCATFLCAAGEPPEVPEALQPYIEDGRFEPGDYHWIKGRFDDATAAEKAAHEAINAWRLACYEQGRETLRAELAQRGYPDVELNISRGAEICEDAGFEPQVSDLSSFAAFSEELRQALPIVESYLFAVGLAERINRPHTEDLGRQLERRVLGEQMLRMAYSWGQGNAADAPPLSPAGRAIAQARIGRAMVRHDRENTAWLKQILEKRGWPRLSEVGEEAAGNAWLLAQHADMDPAFQLDALRAMEPLVAQGEVSKQNYAYLYDRVMLKLAGKQRYGTQATCVGGHFVPQTLESEADLDRLRSDVGLTPIAEYMELMEKNYGTCQEPPKPS